MQPPAKDVDPVTFDPIIDVRRCVAAAQTAPDVSTRTMYRAEARARLDSFEREVSAEIANVRAHLEAVEAEAVRVSGGKP